MNALKLGVIAMCLASAAGCSAATPTADKPTGPPKNGGTYDTPEQIVEALDDGNLDCLGLVKLTGADNPDMTQRCTGGGDDVYVRVFEQQLELESERDAFDDVGIYEGQTMLIGKNWNLVGPDTFIEDAHGILGGELNEGA